MVPPTRRCRVERIASSGAGGGIIHVKAVEKTVNLFVKRIRNNHHKRDSFFSSLITSALGRKWLVVPSRGYWKNKRCVMLSLSLKCHNSSVIDAM